MAERERQVSVRDREEVAEVLRRVGVQDDEARRMLQDVPFPATLDVIYSHLARHGIISRDTLTDAMGGSP
jgi:hypothetical protein